METSKSSETPHIAADKVSFWIFLVTLFLVPIFFIPSQYAPLQLGKTLIILLPLIVGIMVWILGRLKEGKLIFPRNWTFAFFLIIPFIFGLSTIFSGSRVISLVGHSFEIGTFAFVTAMFLLSYLVYQIFTSTRRAAYAYLAFLASFLIIALFQAIRLFAGPGVLSFGIFTSSTSSIVGSWNDLGIYFGAAALFSFVSLEILSLERQIKGLFFAVLVVSLFFLSVISFATVWYVIALFALIFFIYNFSFNQSGQKAEMSLHRKLPLTSLVVLVIALVFILIKGNLYDIMANGPFNMGLVRKFDISNVEVRPSFVSTFEVGKDSIKLHPIFGTGPNRFLNQWLLSKPTAINNTDFWNSDFQYGYGLIPTFLVTTGLIGFVAWLAFLGFFIVLGFKAIFSRRTDPFKDYIRISSFIIALYFWMFAVVYVPSAAILFLTFFFTGLIGTTSFNFVRDPKISFVSVLVFVAILLLALISGYEVILRSVSAFYYEEGIAAATVSNNVSAAENYLARAIQFSSDDSYYQALSGLYLSDINTLVADQKQLSQDTIQTQFRNDLSNAQAAALDAKNFDPTNYQNYISLGEVSESVLPLNITGAYESAQAAYFAAQKLDPVDPTIPLILARLEVAHNNDAQAKVYINQALAMKSDYTDALLLLSQIQVNEGDLPSAIQSVDQATLISPTDAGLEFELGLLRYDNKDYQDAASAFEQATALVPNYANAQYFLGLSLAKLGDTADALKEFQAILVSNPNNQQVTAVIANLQAGRDPLYGLEAPANAPETAPTAPVSDSATPAKSAQ
jgi:tetratricopeptide (TPR) repeat protein